MPLPRSKLAVVHCAKRDLELSDPDYRELLWRAARVESASQLDDYGFNAVMKTFAELGFENDFSRANFGHRDGMATPRQVALIRARWSEFTDGKGTDESLGKWLDARGWVSSVRFLDPDLARKAIAALNSMVAAKRRKAGR